MSCHDHPPLDEIVFAHASERVAAEILDFYRIRWQYEPRTFPLEWDGQGRVDLVVHTRLLPCRL